MTIKNRISAIVVMFAACSVPVNAGFLEMPDIEQFGAAEEKTMLRDMDVPALKDRSPDPTAGPRLSVSEFRIQGLVEYPELGITHQALAELVEGIRFELMGEGELLESGYTVDELGELSDLLSDIEEETVDRHVSPLEVQKLVWLIRGQRSKRGVTLGQIETVAHEITHFYRQRGFVLAKAYIPKQRVRDGVVNLTLLLGMLGDVSVNGNELYRAETLNAVFDGLLGEPVTNKMIEKNLFIISDYPGLTVDGFFEPGAQIGDTRLNINVKDERHYMGHVRLDNHGTDEAGLYRLYTDIQLNNTLGLADYLRASLLRAESPANTTYWQFAYDGNFFSPRFRLGLESSRNQFAVDRTEVANLELNGEVDVLTFKVRYIERRGRTRNSSYELRSESIKSDLQIGDIIDFNNALDEELTHWSFKYNFDFLDDKNKRLHDGSIKYTRGSFDFGAKTGQEKNYHILSLDYTLLTFLTVPFTESESRLLYRSSFQYAGLNLSKIARFSLAGPTRARGFSPSFFTADDALYIGADWIFNSPDFLSFNIGNVSFDNFVKPVLFVDIGVGQQYGLLAGERDVTGTLADVGFGFQFTHSDGFSGNLQFAFPVLDEFSEEGVQPEVDSMRMLFDLQYGF
ncbi:MAG: ShlB/FhaC/HecB family hemolysin secretion/activation protein [Gammaproteobacteria bacterium]|nr:ShlB/FhaC/HecB family hemolysin secretion/activation protein [Gammaproteobacteria bacterium]